MTKGQAKDEITDSELELLVSPMRSLRETSVPLGPFDREAIRWLTCSLILIGRLCTWKGDISGVFDLGCDDPPAFWSFLEWDSRYRQIAESPKHFSRCIAHGSFRRVFVAVGVSKRYFSPPYTRLPRAGDGFDSDPPRLSACKLNGLIGGFDFLWPNAGDRGDADVQHTALGEDWAEPVATLIVRAGVRLDLSDAPAKEPELNALAARRRPEWGDLIVSVPRELPKKGAKTRVALAVSDTRGDKRAEVEVQPSVARFLLELPENQNKLLAPTNGTDLQRVQRSVSDTRKALEGAAHQLWNANQPDGDPMPLNDGTYSLRVHIEVVEKHDPPA